MNKYYPILKAKRGELNALKKLSSEVSDSIVPILEFPPIPIDAKGYPSKTLKSHIETTVNNIQKAVGDMHLFFACLNRLRQDHIDQEEYLYTYFLDLVSELGLNARLVFGISQLDNIFYQELLESHSIEHICLRMEPETIFYSNKFRSQLKSPFGLKRDKLDIIFDLGITSAEYYPLFKGLLPRAINKFPWVHEWNHVIISGASFPSDLGGIPLNKTSLIPRLSWRLWQEIQTSPLVVDPAFSDYGIRSVGFFEGNPTEINPSAAIRYTAAESWLVVKGKSLFKRGFVKETPGFSQFHVLSEVLIENKAYCGPNYSSGDKFINDCAMRRTRGPGNLTVWTEVGTSHHLTFVVEQISSFHEKP